MLPETFGLGRNASESDIARLDIDIMPNGMQLPIGIGTTAAGEKIYVQKCLGCHGLEGRNGVNDQLVEKFDADNDFANDRSRKRTIGNYWPFATTLFDYIKRSMPMTAPGSLTADEIYSLVAYLLYMNEIIDKETILDAESLPSIEMPAKRLFFWSDEAKKLAGNTVVQ
jgi:cytochrome c